MLRELQVSTTIKRPERRGALTQNVFNNAKIFSTVEKDPRRATIWYLYANSKYCTNETRFNFGMPRTDVRKMGEISIQ